DRLVGGWQLNASATVQSGLPFDVIYRDFFLDGDVFPHRPDVIGDPNAGGGTKARWYNATPSGPPRPAPPRPPRRTFRTPRRNPVTGPGYWRVDASLFKRIALAKRAALELRVEAVNVFNHVNLGYPDRLLGVPGSDNPNAGRISQTASFNRDPQRNQQFGVRLRY